MKSLVLIILFLVVTSLNVLAGDDNRVFKHKDEIEPKYSEQNDGEKKEYDDNEKNGEEATEKEEEEEENEINGLMTEITKKYALISGKKYSFSKSSVIKYQSGSIIKNIAVFRATESVNVTVKTNDDYTIKELIIGMPILRD